MHGIVRVTLLHDAQVPRLDLSRLLFPHTTRESHTFAVGQQLADDDDIWHTLHQPAAGAAKRMTCNAFELCIKVCEYHSTLRQHPTLCCAWTQRPCAVYGMQAELFASVLGTKLLLVHARYLKADHI